jgi:uncharacterized protein (DUF486 family)
MRVRKRRKLYGALKRKQAAIWSRTNISKIHARAQPRRIAMKTVFLLLGSNIFMTLAWYGHLRFKWFEGKPLIVVIVACWALAFFEYCLQVPANRIGFRSGEFDGYQLKIVQEAITLGVFIVFAWVVLKERLTWNYAVSFGCMALAVYFAMSFKSPGR